METKILINELSLNANNQLREVNLFISDLSGSYLSVFESLHVGQLTNEILRDSLMNSCSMIENLINEQVEKDLKKVSNVIIRNALTERINIVIQGYKAIVSNITSKHNISLLEYITVVNGQILLQEDAEERIKEDNKYYISDPKEIEIFNTLSTLCIAHNKLHSLMGEKGRRYLQNNLITDFIDLDVSSWTVTPSDRLNYDFLKN